MLIYSYMHLRISLLTHMSTIHTDAVRLEYKLRVYVFSFLFTQLCVCFKEIGKNLAPGGTATQSSTYRDKKHLCVAELAIDGNTHDRLDKQSCTQTNEETEPWWKVTFKNVILVKEVLIVNRGDCCGKCIFHVVFPK